MSLELLQNELTSARAKIVLLDNQLKDKEEENTSLWARIKIFEDKYNKDILDRYFPHPSQKSSQSADSLNADKPTLMPQPPASSATSSGSGPSLPPTSYCLTPPVCHACPGCRSQHYHCHAAWQPPAQPGAQHHSPNITIARNSEITQLCTIVETLREKLQLLSDDFKRLKVSLNPENPSHNPTGNTSDNLSVADTGTNSCDINYHDVSSTSVEEFMENISATENPESPLNLGLTTQL